MGIGIWVGWGCGCGWVLEGRRELKRVRKSHREEATWVFIVGGLCGVEGEERVCLNFGVEKGIGNRWMGRFKKKKEKGEGKQKNR